MSDELHIEEAKIDQRFLRENQPFQEGWYSTVKAVYAIRSKNLISKGHYKGVNDYIKKRWDGCCTRMCFYRLAWAGKVISSLEKAGFSKDDLPSNTRLCVAIKHVIDTYNISYGDAWNTLLERYGSRDNIYSNDVKNVFCNDEPTPMEVDTPVAAKPRSVPLRINTDFRAAGFQEPTPTSPEPEEGTSRLKVLQDGRENYADLFAERLLQEMEAGRVKAALYLNSVNAYLRKSIQTLSTEALSCIFHERLTFTLSEHDCALSGRSRGDVRTVTPFTLLYVEKGGREKDDDFVRIFGSKGLIPGYNMSVYKGNLRPTPQMSTYLEVCAGIGTGALALQRVYPEGRCMGAYEVNEEAIKVYEKHFPDHPMLGDVLEVDTFQKVDLIIGGCPCQSFSAMGHWQGFEDVRGDVFLRVIETLKRTREIENGPTHVLFENVSMREDYLNRITELLEEALGKTIYVTKWNSKYFSAQNRLRIYWSTFYIPEPSEERLLRAPVLRDILEPGNHKECTMNLTGTCQKANLEKQAREMGKWDKPFTIHKTTENGLKYWRVHPDSSKARVVLANQGPFQMFHDGNIFRTQTILE
ncbi:hypothetical protein HDV00_011396 [Rhizophlyctis rosea]|nr:hypothetical protein HDV00_011396 [Rhizophlyctis rosea]